MSKNKKQIVDIDEAIIMVKKNPKWLIKNPEWQDYMKVVLAAVSENGLILEHLSLKLKNTKKVVLAAIKENVAALNFASTRLKRDVDVVSTAVKYDVVTFSNKVDIQISNENLAMELLKINGITFDKFSSELKDNYSIVIEAVKRYPRALLYASDRLRHNENVLTMAVTSNGRAIRYAPIEMRNNKKLMLLSIANDQTAFEFATKKLKREIVNDMVREKGSYVNIIFLEQIEMDYQIVYETIKADLRNETYYPSFYYEEFVAKTILDSKELKDMIKNNPKLEEEVISIIADYLQNGYFSRNAAEELFAGNKEPNKRVLVPGAFYFIEANKCGKIFEECYKEFPMLVEYIGENKFREYISHIELEINDNVLDITDDLKKQYYSEVYSKEDMLIDILSKDYIEDIDEAQSLATIDNIIYKQKILKK